MQVEISEIPSSGALILLYQLHFNQESMFEPVHRAFWPD